MTAYSLVQWNIGAVGFPVNAWLLNTAASYTEVTTAGFIEKGKLSPDDWVLAVIANSVHLIMQVTNSGGVTTLSVVTEEASIPTVLGSLVAFANTSGKKQSGYAPASNPLGGMILGASGVAGPLKLFPSTAASGYLQISATANTGNTALTLATPALGQATTYTIGDPGTATAGFVYKKTTLVPGNYLNVNAANGEVVDSAKFLTASQLTWSGGSSSNSFVFSGCTTSTNAIANLQASANVVTILSAVCTTDLLTITFSGDPGAGTLISVITIQPS